MKSKKSRFWLFVFSFLPGAGEMYMGFMKMGVSLLAGFVGSIAVVSLTGLSVLSVVPIVIYIYAFFHAHNVAGLDDAAFEALEDTYLFGMEEMDILKGKLKGKYRNIAAAVLIVLGIAMLWDVSFGLLVDIYGWQNRYLMEVYYFVRDEVPRLLIGIAIICVGVVMLRGRRKEEKEQNVIEDRENAVSWSGDSQENSNHEMQ